MTTSRTNPTSSANLDAQDRQRGHVRDGDFLDAVIARHDAAIRAEALAGVQKLADEWSTVDATGAAMASALRAVLGDPDAIAKHNAAIWDEAYDAGWDDADAEAIDPRSQYRLTHNPYRTGTPS